MTDLGKPSYLKKRNGAWYYRRRYPADVAARLGRAEFVKSLRTGTYSEALRLIPETEARYLDEVASAAVAPGASRRSTPNGMPNFDLDLIGLTSSDVASLAQLHFNRGLHRLDVSGVPSFRSPDWETHVADLEGDLAILSDPDDPNASRWAEIAEIELLAQQGFRTDPRADASRMLRGYLRRSMLQLARLEHARLHGDYTDVVTDSLFLGDSTSRLSNSPISEPASRTGIMLEPEIVDLWAAERNPVEKGVDAHRAVARWFYQRTSKKPVDRITRADVLAFKAALLGEGQSAANIKQKLSRLRTLLQWAADNGYSTSNAAQGITIKDAQAAKRSRMPFDLPSLTAIFSSPVFSQNARPLRLRGDAAYWMPVLALFTGARMEELGQLRPIDVVQRKYANEDGEQKTAWFILIREDRDAGLKLKNAGSERRIPVHPELMRLGFISFATHAAEKGQVRLFSELRPDKYGRLTAKWGENWSNYKRSVCGVTDPRMVFHSFRHTFKDNARMAGMQEGVARQLMGHRGRDVADRYGTGHPDHILVEAMNLYKVPGLAIPAPLEALTIGES